MMLNTNRLKLRGLYLVVDTTIPEQTLFPIVDKALEGGVNIVQLWGEEKNESLPAVAADILALTRRHGALCIVGDDVELCKRIGADGVHFDGYANPPLTPFEAKQQLGSDAVIGVTCGNNVEKLRWAQENGADYVSFCAMYPSSSVDTCEIVPLEMIRTAKRMLSIPVFASGGITVENVEEVLNAGADGIAVVSAILRAPDPRAAAAEFKEKLQRFVTS